jgi:hypothetical protein
MQCQISNSTIQEVKIKLHLETLKQLNSVIQLLPTITNIFPYLSPRLNGLSTAKKLFLALREKV